MVAGPDCAPLPAQPSIRSAALSSITLPPVFQEMPPAS